MKVSILPMVFCQFVTAQVVVPLPEVEVVASQHDERGVGAAATSIFDDIDFSMNSARAGTFEDQLVLVPGAYAGNPFSGTFSLRGMGQDGILGYLNNGSNPLIAVMENGVPLSVYTVRYLPPPQWNLDRMEVRRGPQLHLTGPNAIAGAVLLDQHVPSLDFQGRMMTEVGEYGTFRNGISQDFVLIPGELGLHASSFNQESDGYETNRFDDDEEYGASRRNRQDIGLRWLPGGTGESTIDLSVTHDQLEGNPLALVREAQGSDFYDRNGFVDTTPAYPAERWAGVLNASFVIGEDTTLQMISGVQSLNRESRTDLDDTALLNWFTSGGSDEIRFTQYLGLSGGKDRLKWTLGSYYEHSEYYLYFNGVGGVPFPMGSPFRNHASENVGIASIDGQFDWELAKGWHATGGLRLNYESRRIEAESSFGPVPTVQSSDDLSEFALLPELGIEWRPDPSLSSGVRVVRAYRAAGFSHAPSLGVVRPFDQEKGWEIEWTSQKNFDEFQLSSSLFHSWLDDMQVPYDVAGGFTGIDTLVANAGRSRRYGAEIETRWLATSSISLFGSLGWVRHQFDELWVGGEERSGEKFPNAPEWTASLGISYAPPTGVFGSLLFSYADSTFSSVQDSSLTHLESRQLLSAKLGYAWDHVKLYVYGSNLLNDEYAVFRLQHRALDNSISGKAGAPRTFGVGAEMHW